MGAAQDGHCADPAAGCATVAGSHFIQEDSPNEIGKAIAEWLSNLKQT